MQGQLFNVITFATTPEAGNPAHVLRIPGLMDGTDYTETCRALDVDILAVLFEQSGSVASIDFFTQRGRHGGAGHATHGAAHLILSENGAGTLIKHDGSRQAILRKRDRISIEWPLMPYAPIDRWAEINAVIGMRPLEVFTSTFGHVAIFENEHQITSLKPNFDLLAKLDCNALIVTAPGNHSDIVLRVFAPKLGLPEDPVCGTAHRIIVPYWREKLGRGTLHSRQLSPRGGDLYCDLSQNRVWISGVARTLSSSNITVVKEKTSYARRS